MILIQNNNTTNIHQSKQQRIISNHQNNTKSNISSNLINDYRNDINNVRSFENEDRENCVVDVDVDVDVDVNTNSKNDHSFSTQQPNKYHSTRPFGTQKKPNNTNFNITTNNPIDLFVRDSFSKLSDKQYKIDYLQQIPKAIKSNFNVKLQRQKQKVQSTKTTRSSFSTALCSTSSLQVSNTHQSKNTSSNVFSDEKELTYTRCVVEDFMLLKKNDYIKVYIPSSDRTFIQYVPSSVVEFGSRKKYRVYECVVLSSPSSEKVDNGELSYLDINHGFTHGNFGCFISLLEPTLIDKYKNGMLFNPNEDANVMLTWYEVLNGRMDGVQVWKKLVGPMSDLYPLFRRRKKKLESLRLLVNFLYPELFGDRLQCQTLLTCFYRSMSEHLNAQSVASTSLPTSTALTTKSSSSANFKGNTFRELIERIDTVFKAAIHSRYSQFSLYNEPLLSEEQLSSITNDYITSMPEHYEVMKNIIGYDSKEKHIRNAHLLQRQFYDRKLLHLFLNKVRIMCPKNLVYYGVANTVAHYGRGQFSRSITQSVHAGINVTYDTMMARLRSPGDDMENKLKDLLRKMNNTVFILDNNQKGFGVKFQRNGRTNDYIVVTSRLVRHCEDIIIEETIPPLSENIPLTYINQVIPSMYKMPHFERLVQGTFDDRFVFNTIASMPNTNKFDIDYTGNWVKKYIQMLNISEVVTNVICKYFSNY